MPARKRNMRLNLTKSPTDTAPATDDTAPVRIALDASDAPAPAPVTDDTAAPDAAPDAAPVAAAPDAPVTDAAPDAPAPDAAPVAPVTAAPVAVPDAKAAFLDKKATATLSALSQYSGASLAVHRSDKQPADGTYLARVASPVQKIGPNGPTARDNSFILAVYDYLSNYFAANYSIGFNPANFGADLGTTSRAASVGYLALTADGSDIILTDSGIERGALLSRKRAEAAAKAAAQAAK
jgi:hypothetical protein